MILRLAQVLALLLSALPWAALAAHRGPKPEAALSSPHKPQPVLQEAAPGGGNTAPTPPVSVPFRPVPGLRLALERGQLLGPAAPRPTPRRHMSLLMRLQLDGG